MQGQPGIQAYFRRRPAKGRAGRQPPGGDTAADTPGDGSDAPAGAAEQPPAPALQQFARKRMRTAPTQQAAALPAAPAAGALPAKQPTPGGTAAAAPSVIPQATRPRQLMQLYLDVGQRDFHSCRCPTCGMVYARGAEADERLHAAFHASATSGPRYQGWQGERVVEVDGSRGRVLLFSGAEQSRSSKLQELCSFLEEQMGLPRGWLLRVPLTVLLYVSPARRIQAVVAAEAIREACHVQPGPPPPGAAAAVHSRGSAAAAAGGGSSAGGGGGPPKPAAAAAQAATSARSLLSVTLSSSGVGGGGEGGSSSGGGGGGSGGAAAAEAAAPAAAEGMREGRAEGPAQLQLERRQHEQQQQQQQQRQEQAQQQQQPASQAAAAAPRWAGAAAAAAAAPGAAASPEHAPLVLDSRRRVRAVCGVRLMWVSLEARRRGLASRLVDCCRCQFMPGYVLPRHELAFSAPTDAGRAFIERYTGSRRFLVYG